MAHESVKSEDGTLNNAPKKSNDKMKNRFIEQHAKVSMSTYKNFFLAAPANYVVLPITLFLFVLSEGVITVYYRILADFDNVKLGVSSNFGANIGLYWGILAMLAGVYFVVYVIKFYMLYFTLLSASAAVH
jgi:hypothetical protein